MLGKYFDYDTFVILVSIVGGCAIVSVVFDPSRFGSYVHATDLRASG